MALEDALVLTHMLTTHGSAEEACCRSVHGGLLAPVGWAPSTPDKDLREGPWRKQARRVEKRRAVTAVKMPAKEPA
jgi:hypothetical protein